MGYQYKIELRLRNHNTLKRDKLIPEIAKCVPEGHTVSLDNPELFILVEIFKVSNRPAIVQGLHSTWLYRVSAVSALLRTITNSRSSMSWRSLPLKTCAMKVLRAVYWRKRRRLREVAVARLSHSLLPPKKVDCKDV